MTTNAMSNFINSIYSEVVKATPHILTGIVIFIVFWLLAIIIEYIIKNLSTKSKHRKPLYALIGKTVKIFILLAGIISGLGTMGMNVSALVAGLGLTGFALGFALKDSLSNVLAGFLVLFYQPFKVNDYISVSNMEGQVIEINLRYTILKTDAQETLVPNATILSNPVTVKLNTNL